MKIVDRFKNASERLSICIFLCGCVVLAGWILDISALKSVFPDLVTMKFNTSLCFIFIGLSLWLLQEKRAANLCMNKLAFFCAWVVFLIGSLTFCEYLFGLSLGIDQLFIKESVTAVMTSSPGRMALNTSVNFIIISLAIFMIRSKSIFLTIFSELMIFFVGCNGLFSLLGYSFGVSPLYFGLQFSTAMALHTTVLFLMIFFCYFLAKSDRGIMCNFSSDLVGSVVLRKIFPVVVFVPLFLGWLKINSERLKIIDSGLGVVLVAVFNLLISGTFVYFLSKHMNGLEIKKKELEKTLWENEDRFKTLVSNVPGAIYRCQNDAQWSMDFISYAIREISGYPASDFINNKVRSYESIIYASDRSVVRDKVSQALLNSETYNIDYRIVHSDGSLRWVVERGQGIFGESGLLWLDGAIFDYTERKKILEDLKYASVEWQRTFDSMSDLVFILDKDFTIIKANKACFTGLKLKPEEMIGKKCYQVVHGLGIAWPNCPFGQTCMDQKMHTEEVDDPRLGITLLATTSPIYKDNGEFVGAIHIAKDITLIKNYQRDLEQKNHELKKLDKLKSEFVSVVSHELRTPLSIIKEGISLVLDGITGKTNSKQDKILNTSKDNIDRLARIINNLLDISKIESGKIELDKKLIDLNDLVRKVVSAFDLKLKEKKLELRIKQPLGQLDILIDEDRIIEVFTNLINNALKFTNQGYINVEVIDYPDKVQCVVEDTGIGIQKENLPKLFNKFIQFDRLDGPGDKGTGLGLSIAQGLVNLHGGKIWAESEFGQGTRIYFTLPKN